MWKFLVPVGVLVVAAVVAGLAVGGNRNGNDKTFQYAIGLWGDLPYSAVQENPGIPNLLADLRAARVLSDSRSCRLLRSGAFAADHADTARRLSRPHGSRVGTRVSRGKETPGCPTGATESGDGDR